MKGARAVLGIILGLSMPFWLHAGPVAYITHQNGVSVVDLDARAVIAELPGNGASGVAVRAENNRAYVADVDKVSVIDMRAQAVVATAGYPTVGGLITVRPQRPEAFVVTSHCSNVPSTACTPDLRTVVRILNTDVNVLGDSFDDSATARIAFNGDGSLLYLTRSAPATLVVLNASTRQLLANLALASPPVGLVFDAARNRIYVVETGGDVAMVDAGTLAVIARIAVGTNPSDAAIAGNRLFVTNHGGNNVSVVDLDARAVVGNIAVGSGPTGIDATPNGDRVVVANTGSNSVSVIDATSLNIVATIAVGPSPMAIGRFIAGSSAPQLPDVLTGLWWNPAEPGWGVHVAHRGNRIFAAWFTYGANGAPKWYVSSDCTMNGNPPPGFSTDVSCSGNIYDTTGPRFFSDPYNPGVVNVTKEGLFQMTFSSQDTGGMSVVIGNAVKSMPLKRQVFRTEGPSAPVDFTDLWWNPAESGWGLGITQQAGTMFLAWFAYDDSGTATWYVASNCAMNASANGCNGDLYRTSGPIDPLRNAFDSSKVKVTRVGSIDATFSDANTGSISYTVDGKSGTKQITRQLF